jgi:hypothetical protein
MFEGLNKHLSDIRPGDSVPERQRIVTLAYLDRSCTGLGIGEKPGSDNGIRKGASPNLILRTSAPRQSIPLDQVQDGGSKRGLSNSNGCHVEEPTAESSLLSRCQRVPHPIVFRRFDEPWIMLDNKSCQ